MIEMAAEEIVAKNTYEMTFDESQDFIYRLAQELNTMYLVNHLKKHQ